MLKAQHRRVKNALAHVLLAGVHQADKLHVAVEAQESAGQKQVRTPTYSSNRTSRAYKGIASSLFSTQSSLPSPHALSTSSARTPPHPPNATPAPLSCAFDVLLWEAHTQ